MSRFRASLTPFDPEPTDRTLDEVDRMVRQYDNRKRIDLDKFQLFATELFDGYSGDVEVNKDRDEQLVIMVRCILENRHHYRRFKSRLRTWGPGSSSPANTPSQPSPSTQNVLQRVPEPQTELRPEVPSASQSDTTVSQERRSKAPGHTTSSRLARIRQQPRSKFFRDIMPRNGVNSLTTVDREQLSNDLYRQLETINQTREKTIDVNECKKRYSGRKVFKYRINHYVACCPIHPDLNMDFEQAKDHYESKHVVALKKRSHHEVMRFFGVRLTGSKTRIERLAMAESIPQRRLPPIAEVPGTKSKAGSRISDNSSRRLSAQTGSRFTHNAPQNTHTASEPQQNDSAGANAALSTESTESNRTASTLAATIENISSDANANPDRSSEAPPQPALTRNRTPEQSEANDILLGSSNNPFVVLDTEEDTQSDTLPRYLQTPSPVAIKVQSPSSSKRIKPGVPGIKLSPHLTRPRTPAGSSIAAEACTARDESQAPELGTHDDWLNRNQDQQQIQKAAEKFELLRQIMAGDSESPKQTASPPPSRAASVEVQAWGARTAVDELTGIVNRNFTRHHCPRCGAGFSLQTYLDQHKDSCTGQTG